MAPASLHTGKTFLRLVTLAVCAGAAVCVVAAQGADALVWKPVLLSLLSVDDRPVRLWKVYQPDKKPALVMVQIGLRYLFIDVEAREVYEVAPQRYTRKGDDLLGPAPGPKDDSAKLLPTADWMVRPAGRVMRVRMKLTDEGRVLEVQLPYVPDLRRFF